MTAVPQRVRLAVYDRDLHMCAGCRRPYPLTLHHRIPRGMGGSKNPRLNLHSHLLTLCGSGTTGCHGWTETHREDARQRGWLVARTSDPATVPVWTWRGWVQLHSDGDLSFCHLPSLPDLGAPATWTPKRTEEPA